MERPSSSDMKKKIRKETEEKAAHSQLFKTAAAHCILSCVCVHSAATTAMTAVSFFRSAEKRLLFFFLLLA